MKVKPVFAITGSRYTETQEEEQPLVAEDNRRIRSSFGIAVLPDCPLMRHPFLAGAIALYLLALLYYVRKAAR